MLEDKKNIPVLKINRLSNNITNTYILRLDEIHPVISGNKWFKLRFYLEEAQKQNKTTIASFGGAYSNHIAAMAYACKINGLASVGIIRGEAAAERSHTLKEAEDQGMELIFVSREAYRQKQQIQREYGHPNWYWINEGGYGIKGAEGAATMLAEQFESYTHIICAVGTGTMMAGLIRGINSNQQVLGISVLKNHYSAIQEVMELLRPEDLQKQFSIIPDYHFGGYAKYPPALIEMMNEFWITEKIPTDIVYTGKLIYAVNDLIAKNYFPEGSKLLIIHSGGLQGNRSLPEGTLLF